MIKAKEKHSINYIDPSSLCTFNRCPAKYYLSRVLGLSKPDTTARDLALDYGTDMHEALPHCYDEGGIDKAIEIFRSRWEARNRDGD